jgi:hypothetical protein
MAILIFCVRRLWYGHERRGYLKSEGRFRLAGGILPFQGLKKEAAQFLGQPLWFFSVFYLI